jgi:hypothetical protein
MKILVNMVLAYNTSLSNIRLVAQQNQSPLAMSGSQGKGKMHLRNHIQ